VGAGTTGVVTVGTVVTVGAGTTGVVTVGAVVTVEAVVTVGAVVTVAAAAVFAFGFVSEEVVAGAVGGAAGVEVVAFAEATTDDNDGEEAEDILLYTQ
jgi:hypothetical protein